MIRLGTIALVIAACMPSNPPPQYAQQPPPPPGAEAAPPATQPAPPPPEQPAATVQPAPPPEEPPPIDPDKPMPKESLSTEATLKPDSMDTVTIDGRADIYSSGLKKADKGRGGMLPAALTLAGGGGVVTFPRVKGKSGCQPGESFPPDGGACAGGNTTLESAGPISGIVAHDRTLFLVGVFVGKKPPAKAPETLDFSPDKQGTEFAKLEPKLGQVFFIGDGQNARGEAQQFVIPAGATRLFLGYADGFAFQGTPASYGDNTGGLSVSVVQKAK